MKGRQKIACPLCANKKEKFLFYKDSFKVVKCNICDLVYINPRLGKEETAKLYNLNKISPAAYYRENIEGDKKAFQKRWRTIEKFAEKKGKVLDIGCNIGTFLKVAKEKGWDCYGIDLNKQVEKECKEAGIKFFAKSIDNVKFDKGFFDVIIVNDVLEHVHEPKMLIKKVRNMLKPRGILFLVTPNIESITAKVLRKRWHHLKPTEHLVYFSKSTLAKLLRMFNLEILEMKRISRDRGIGTIINKSESLIKQLSSINKVLPKKVREITIPLNTFDELGVVARKG